MTTAFKLVSVGEFAGTSSSGNDLPDSELIAKLQSAVAAHHRTTAQILSCLLEVEDRRIHVRAAIPSLAAYCVKMLGMSEDQAARRTAVLSTLRKFPKILAFVECGDIHLTNLLTLRDYLTQKNHEELLVAASRRTKAGLSQLLAERFPQPAVPSTIESLGTLPLSPCTRTTNSLMGSLAVVTEQSGHQSSAQETLESQRHQPTQRMVFDQVTPLAAEQFKVTFTANAELRQQIARATDLMAHRNPTRDLVAVMQYMFTVGLAALEKERLGKSARRMRQKTAKSDGVLAPATATTETASTARQAKENEDAVSKTNEVEEAGPQINEVHPCESTETLAEAKASLAVTSSVHKIRTSKRTVEANRRAVPQEARFAVFERDGLQCAFVSEEGSRCEERALLEVDHIVPRALGGTNDLSNLRVRCKHHNNFEAEEIFGREHMEAARTRKAKPHQRGAAIVSNDDRATIHETIDDTPRKTDDSEPQSLDKTTFDTVSKALVNMGFRAQDTREALSRIKTTRSESLAMNDRLAKVIREALALLT